MSTDLDFNFLLVMGVAGSGKSHVAQYVAQALNLSLVEADDYHPIMNVQRMSQGLPLNDELRWPWLAAVAEAAVVAQDTTRRPVVIACSALKQRYRDFLNGELKGLRVIYLYADAHKIRSRLAARSDHYMLVGMLDSQLADLEPPHPDTCWMIDVSPSKEEVLKNVLSRIQTHQRAA